MPKFRLCIELVPQILWGVNLRSNQCGLGPYRWRKLSREVRARLGKCAICGGKDRLHGHEIWKYNQIKRTGYATLLDVNAICIDCHSVNHWGRTRTLGSAGIISAEEIQRLIDHFLKVNGCPSAKSFDRHSGKMFDQWNARNKIKTWHVHFGKFTSAIEEAEAARERYAASRSLDDEYDEAPDYEDGDDEPGEKHYAQFLRWPRIATKRS